MTKTARLWLTEQRQVMEMPAVDLQMQYGLTVRPVELVREIEDPFDTRRQLMWRRRSASPSM